MSYSPRQRYSPLPRRSSRSRSRSPARSYRERHDNVENAGDNLYVTGLSIRVTEKDLEKYFAKVGEVIEAHLVVDPWTRESRGFGFVTMSGVKDADRCIRHLNGSTLEGRIITVEKVSQLMRQDQMLKELTKSASSVKGLLLSWQIVTTSAQL